MTRLILTFETLFQVLTADKLLKGQLSCRPTPTPPGLSTAICGVSLEILQQREKDLALNILDNAGVKPTGIHDIA